MADEAFDDVRMAGQADLIIVATAVGHMGGIAADLSPHIKPGAIITDVGSVKGQVMADMAPHIPGHAHFIPGHPIAGTEKSGPGAGFRELFENRWVILTPDASADQGAFSAVQSFWQACGAHVAQMPADVHDRVLAITSHLPHLIAFTIDGDFMKKTRYTDAQIMGILKQAEDGVPVSELCREHGMSSASFYKWRAKYGGMDASMMAELRETKAELQRLKRMYADLSLQNDLIRDALSKK